MARQTQLSEFDSREVRRTEPFTKWSSDLHFHSVPCIFPIYTIIIYKTEKEMITDDSQFLMELCHPPYFKIQEVKNTFNMPKMKLKA